MDVTKTYWRSDTLLNLNKKLEIDTLSNLNKKLEILTFLLFENAIEYTKL